MVPCYIIRRKTPEYLQAFYQVFQGNFIYPCHMFITSKTLLNNYCEWLFSIIIDAAEQIDVSEYSAYSKRIIGFIAERLLTVWIVQNNINVKEVAILFTE